VVPRPSYTIRKIKPADRHRYSELFLFFAPEIVNPEQTYLEHQNTLEIHCVACIKVQINSREPFPILLFVQVVGIDA
jgi:hypothetical protein